MNLMLNSWATLNRIIRQYRKDLAVAILEGEPQLQWKTWWKEESPIIEQLGRARGIKIFQDQHLNEVIYANF